MKTALYARVSTDEQNPEMQKNALIKKAEQEKWDYEYFEEDIIQWAIDYLHDNMDK